jgi:hypothetical protein
VEPVAASESATCWAAFAPDEGKISLGRDELLFALSSQMVSWYANGKFPTASQAMAHRVISAGGGISSQ